MWEKDLAVGVACHCGYSMTTPRLKHSRGLAAGEETGRRDDETVLGCGLWDVSGMWDVGGERSHGRGFGRRLDGGRSSAKVPRILI